MKTLYLLLTGLSIASGAFCQDDQQAIRQWQSLHPTTYLISADRYNALSAEERELLGSDYILFEDKITLQQLEAHDAALKSTEGNASQPSKEADLQLIKDWQGLHPEVMIIKRSVYDELTEERRQMCYSPAVLVLEGETLTVKDIERFGH